MSTSFAKPVRNVAMAWRKWLPIIPISVCIAVFLFHLSVIRHNAVNVPFWDDWASFQGDDHPASIDLEWLYARHNEHRIATTKIFVWLLFHWNGWNMRTHLVVSFLIYGLLVALLAWFCQRWTRAPAWLMPCFVPFFLTPLGWLDHFFGIAISVHSWLLFFFAAAYLVFQKSQRWSLLLIGWLSATLSIYSNAAGFLVSLILIIGFSLFKLARISRATTKSDRNREGLQLAASIVITGTALIAWLHNYKKPAYHPALTYPYQWEFWSFLVNLVASGLGINRVSTPAGFFCLLLILMPVCGIIWRKRWNMSASEWAVVVSVMALLGSLCAVTMGRAGFGIGDAKNALYTEFGIPFVILSAASWFLVFDNHKRLKQATLTAVWLFFLIVFWNKWGDFPVYRRLHDERMTSFRCVQDYYSGRGDGHCPTAYPADRSLAPFLEQAKRLNASLYRDAIIEEGQK